MKQNKIFIPGLGERTKDYRSLSKEINIHNIDWNNPTVPKGTYDTVIGFSLGALWACEYTLKHKVKTLILCSPTPGIESLSSVKTDKIIFLVGEKEKWCLKEIQRVSNTLKCKYHIYIVAKGTHKIAGKYLSTLLEVIKSVQ